MNGTIRRHPHSAIRLTLGLVASSLMALGQPAQVIFEDDFSSDTIDESRYEPAEPFFEGGEGTIHAEAGDGVMRFVGSTTQQWWSGSTLRIKEKFEVSEASPVTLHIDRVEEAGQGTASRSALWIFDETETRYVLFADVRGEGGWRYNRKIGQTGDVATGSGANISAFDGMDDGLEFTMSMEADGSTVKLFLDDTQGAEVDFPYSPVIFHFGSYARANNDTADTTWDNLRIERVGSVTYRETDLVLMAGAPPGEVTVALPQGANAESEVAVTLVSADADIATPAGGSGGRLDVVFPAGGPESVTVDIEGTGAGTTRLSLESDDINAVGMVDVTVLDGFGTVLADNFPGDSLDSSKWSEDLAGLAGGAGTHTAAIDGGRLKIEGFTDTDSWAGASVRSEESFLATSDINLVLEAERSSVAADGIVRSGVFVSTANRSRYLYFSQQFQDGISDGAPSWHVNINPGSPSGPGMIIPAFASMDDDGSYDLKLVADGSMVEVFLNEASGGRFPFPVSSGIHFGMGAYGRNVDDEVVARFDNASVAYALPCIRIDPPASSLTLGGTAALSVSVPRLLSDRDVTVTVTTSDPSVAVPAGASGDSLTLDFPAESPRTLTVVIQPRSTGTVTISLASDQGDEVCLSEPAALRVHPQPEVFLSDDFGGTGLNEDLWQIESTSFNDTGRAKDAPDSSVSIVDGRLRIHVEVETPFWPGLAVFTRDSFAASDTEPLTFAVDRSMVDFVLAEGTGSESRTGIWARKGDDYILFVDHTTHDARNFGWRYNRNPGADDNEISGDGINIVAFDGGDFDNRSHHRMEMVLDGSTAKLRLDGVTGTELDFPHSEGISFGIGAYADNVGPNDADGNIVGNQTIGFFDNALVTGGRTEVEGPGVISSIDLTGGNLVIEWSGVALQQADTVFGPWTPVDGASPPSTSIPVGPGEKFIRVSP